MKLMKLIPSLMAHLLMVATALTLSTKLQAQATFDKMVYCVGTTAQAGAERWAYVLFQPVKLDLLDGKALAIYQQNGSVGTFVLKSVITGPQTDPSVIKPMLARAESLGQNIAELNMAVSALFQDLVPDATVPLERKISAIIQGASGNPAKRKTLFLLARQHPAMALALGQGIALKLPSAGSYTIEVRHRDSATATGGTPADDKSVIGRVILDTATPLVLPAPGQPFLVEDASAKGHLHAQLRWATPDPLRQVSLSQYGFNVFRMTEAFVTSRSYNVTPPTRTQLAADLLAGQAYRLNRVPILADRDYDAASVVIPTDKTFFVADDNNAFAGGVPFVDGSRYWYFCTARDILGRDGTVSPGRQVAMCDRIAPLPPTDLKVTNEVSYTEATATKKQWLRLQWKTPEANDASSLLKYHVYRWSNIDQIAVNQRTLQAAPTPANPAANPNLIATINHTAGVTSYTLDDLNLPGSPVQPANNGVSFWYTVRAVDNSSCENVSGNSAPQFGVLRDREGPPAAIGDVLVCCYCPSVTFRDSSLNTVSTGDLNRNQHHLNLLCEVAGLGIDETASAEFHSSTAMLGSVPFKLEAGSTAFRARLLVDLPANPAPTSRDISCVVVMASGKRSNFGICPAYALPTTNHNQAVLVNFTTMSTRACLPASGRNPCGGKHEPIDPVTGETNFPEISFAPPTTSREYKIYRRVDDGELTMIKQGTYALGELGPLVVKDDTMPATYCRMCYFVQCFDEHGNASPMALLNCLESCGKLPTPMLAGIEATGNAAAPKVRLRWFCAPAGVARYEIFLHRTSRNYQHGTVALSVDRATHPHMAQFDGGAQQFDFAVLETPLSAGVSSQVTAEYTAELPCTEGDLHHVMIRAVGPGNYASRCAGALSNGEDFAWTGSVAASAAIDVPWPARPIPAKDTTFMPGIVPAVLTTFHPTLGVGIAIGSYTLDYPYWRSAPFIGTNAEIPVTVMPAAGAPASYLFKNSEVASQETSKYAGTLFPYVLFRYQVANAKFPTVSGDVVQVSPMMEEIAYQTSTWPTSGSSGVTAAAHILKDPFIVGVATNASDYKDAFLYALDRQPQIRGAEYKYLFVRFKPATKEIDRVVPVPNSITIP
jgi:hypothetical protein